MLVGLIARGGARRTSTLAPVDELSAEEEQRLRSALQKLDAEESPDW